MAGAATLKAESARARRAPIAERWRCYLTWTGRVGLAFFAVYPTTNWITSQRAARLHLYLPVELALPFVPGLVWIYLSMYALFVVSAFVLPAERMPALGRQLVAGTLVSGLAFLLLPAELGFERAVPAGSCARAYSLLFRLDLPHNLVPSLHVVFSAAIALACADASGRLGRRALQAWLLLIAASTLLVHQHHVLDLVSSLALVLFLRRRFR